MRPFPTLSVALLLVATFSAHAAQLVRTAHARAELVVTAASVAPGDSFRAALRLRPDPGWHVYWSNPGDAGMPPSVDWKLTGGWKAGPLEFPVPLRFETPPLASYGYKDDAWYPMTITADGGAPAGLRASLGVRAEWLICREECVPESADFTVTLDVGRTVPNAENAARVARFADGRLPRAAGVEGVATFEDSAVALSWGLGDGFASAEDLEDAYFFPASQGVLMHAAPQALTLEGGRARLVVKRDDVLRARPDTLRGVLAVGPPEARRGYVLALPVRDAGGARDSGSGLASALLAGLLCLAGLTLLIVFKRPHVPPGTRGAA